MADSNKNERHSKALADAFCSVDEEPNQQCRLDMVSSLDISAKSIFDSRTHARLYGNLLFQLRDASESTLTKFLDFILAKEPGGPLTIEK